MQILADEAKQLLTGWHKEQTRLVVMFEMRNFKRDTTRFFSFTGTVTTLTDEEVYLNDKEGRGVGTAFLEGNVYEYLEAREGYNITGCLILRDDDDWPRITIFELKQAGQLVPFYLS